MEKGSEQYISKRPAALKICDPACGTGHFLVPAARRIARQLAVIGSGEKNPAAEILQVALCRVIENDIYGMDIDPSAVELCKFNLWLEAGKPAELPAILDRRIRCGDSLFFHWHAAFPEVFAEGGFDVLIGNPPFVNAIEGAIPPETKKARRRIGRVARHGRFGVPLRAAVP